jgi:hypothetical protein
MQCFISWLSQSGRLREKESGFTNRSQILIKVTLIHIRLTIHSLKLTADANPKFGKFNCQKLIF